MSHFILLKCLWLVAILASQRPAWGQGQPFSERSAPPGLRAWLGKDSCSTSKWATFHTELSDAVQRFPSDGALSTLTRLSTQLISLVQDPFVSFDCATAVASALVLGAQCSDHLQLPLLSARFRQLGAVFASFDYQMKGEEYIDQSPWPINWLEGMDGILRSMMTLKSHELAMNALHREPLRRIVSDRAARSPLGVQKRVAIVSVCDYDAAVTPLARLSRINKERYARQHSYDVIIHDKSPVFEDPLSPLFTEPISHRPAAWSKVDAILLALASGKYDWVLWMDCDSFFMDMELPLEDVAAVAEEAQCGSASHDSGGDVKALATLLQAWFEGPGALPTSDLTTWYDDLIDAQWSNHLQNQEESGPCTPCRGVRCSGSNAEMNRTLGLNSWLFGERRPHLIASEDGLMLNTGIVLVRSSVWAWQFFQKVRWMTFGFSPVTQHPWWEQTAMVYLLQLPFSLLHAERLHRAMPLADLGPPEIDRGHAPALFLFSQRHLNGYPPLIASALKTHDEFSEGDFIISFSGCKVYSSQEVCNQLFLAYFFKAHSINDFEDDPVLLSWL